MQLDLMRTYNASRAQILRKLRFPASVPFLFTSLKVAVAIALTGAIAVHRVGHLRIGELAVWVGVTAENQEWLDRRVPILEAIPAAIRWISYEPALGPIDISGTKLINWIIAGGEKRRYALADARAAGGLCHGRSVDPDRVGRDLQVECCGGDRRIGDERGDDGAAHHALAA